MDRKLDLLVLNGKFAVCRLNADAEMPGWAQPGGFSSITRTDDELSVICPQENVPENVTAERDFRALRVAGRLDFSQTGIIASLAGPLADAGLSIFTLSTFATDYLLVKEIDLNEAVEVLQRAGHRVDGGEPPTNDDERI